MSTMNPRPSSKAPATSRGRLARHATRVTLLALLVLTVVACDDVINDPTFRQWCGDTLCAWTLETGHIKKSPTWTDKDYGVAFLDTPTRISQGVSDSPRCLKFSTIGDIDISAQLTVSIDFDRDGTEDFTQAVPSAQWTEVETLVTAPKVYSGFTLSIEKKGDGRAVLAQMRVQSSEDCKAPGVLLGKLPIGDRCSNTDPSAATCETGICCYGVCSECCADKDCHVSGGPGLPDGGDAGPAAICATQPVEPASFFALPGQCGPGDHQHRAGAPCIVDADCLSGACDGAIIHGVIVRDEDSGTCSVLGGDAGCRPQAVVGGHCR